jgi:hypothetical protein
MLPVLAAQAADTLYQTSMGALTGAINGLKERFDKAIQIADNAQRNTLALGKTLEEARKDLGGSIKGLRGSLEGQLGVGIQLLRAGLDKNSAGVARLINQQMLTGTAFTNTAKTFAKLEGVLGLTKDASDNLADELGFLGAKFGISTDKLVESIYSLKSTFATQKVLKLGEEFQAAVARLQAEFGPALAEEVIGAVQYILEPSFERTAQLNFAGLGGIREQLLANRKDSNALFELLLNAVEQTTRVFERTAGNRPEMLGVVSQLMGAGAQSLYLLGNAVRRDPKDISREEAFSKFAKQLNVIREEALAPFDSLISEKLYPAFLELNQVVYGSINIFFKSIKNFVDGLTKDGEDLVKSDVFKNLKIALIDVASGLASPLFKISQFIIQGGIDLFIEAIKSLNQWLKEFTAPGAGLDQFRAIIASMPYHLLKFLDGLAYLVPSYTGPSSESLLAAEKIAFEEELRLQVRQGIKLQGTEYGQIFDLEGRIQNVQILNDLGRAAQRLGVDLEKIQKQNELDPTQKATDVLGKAGELFTNIENNPSYALMKAAFDKMRKNAEEGKDILLNVANILDGVETNTAQTAQNTYKPPQALVAASVEQGVLDLIAARNIIFSSKEPIEISAPEMERLLKRNIEDKNIQMKNSWGPNPAQSIRDK